MKLCKSLRMLVLLVIFLVFVFQTSNAGKNKKTKKRGRNKNCKKLIVKNLNSPDKYYTWANILP